ncbi:MAG: DMT family transporter [Planctomycetota bacterium]
MKPRTIIAIAVTLLFWGSAYAGIRQSLREFDPAPLALLRYLVASATMALYAMWVGIRPPEAKDLPAIVICGLVGIAVYHILLNTGQQTVQAGAAGFLIGTSPIFTVLLACVYLRERLRLWGWLGILISFAGVPLIALGQSKELRFDHNALLILGAAICASIYTVYQKPFFKKYTAFEFSAYMIWAGTACLLVFLPAMLTQAHKASWDTIFVVGYLGIFPGAIAYVSWAYILARHQVSTVVTLLYLLPVLAMLIAMIWLGELPTYLSLAGGALALTGVIIVHRWGRSIS